MGEVRKGGKEGEEGDGEEEGEGKGWRCDKYEEKVQRMNAIYYLCRRVEQRGWWVAYFERCRELEERKNRGRVRGWTGGEGFRKSQVLPENPPGSPNTIALNLSHLGLWRIPSFIFGENTLTELNLSHNYLKVLPGDIGGLKNLKHLDVSFNILEGLPRELCKLKLTHLNIEVKFCCFVFGGCVLPFVIF